VLANGWVEGSWGRMGGRLAVTCGGWAELVGVICEDIGGPGKAEEDLVVSKVNSGIVHFSASELNILFTPKSGELAPIFGFDLYFIVNRHPKIRGYGRYKLQTALTNNSRSSSRPSSHVLQLPSFPE